MSNWENRTDKRQWFYIVVGVLVVLVSIGFARLAYGVVLPYMREGLMLTYHQAGLLGTVTAFGYLSTLLLAGLLGARWGGKRTILLGLVLNVLGFAGLTFSGSMWSSMLYMFLLGIGTSFTFTNLASLLTAWFPQKRGLVLGFLSSGVGVGVLFVGLYVPYLAEVDPVNHWRLAWGSFGLFGLLILALFGLGIKDHPQLKGSQASLSLRAQKHVYFNPDLIFSGIIYASVGLTYIVYMTFTMSLMLEVGLDPILAGQLISINGIISIFSGPVWGGISDRLGRLASLVLCTVICLVGLVTSLIYPTVLGFAINILLAGVTMQGLFTLAQALGMDQVEQKDIPVAFSYITLYYAGGQFLGPMIAGWLTDLTGTLKSTYLFSIGLLAVGLIFMYVFHVRKSKAKGDEAARLSL